MGESNIESATGMRLAVDIGTSLVVEITGIDAKIKCTLVGMQAGEFLILRPPKSYAYKLFRVGKSPRAVVRYIYSGRVFGFEAALLGAILEPLGLIFLGYPKQVSEHNLRAAPRLECHLPAKATLNDTEFGGAIEDISPTGCRLSIKTALVQAAPASGPALEMNIRIDLQLPDQPDTLALHGKIKNIEQDANRVALGVAFKDIGEAARAQISRYLADLG
jgi:hypothetical protein